MGKTASATGTRRSGVHKLSMFLTKWCCILDNCSTDYLNEDNQLIKQDEWGNGGELIDEANLLLACFRPSIGLLSLDFPLVWRRYFWIFSCIFVWGMIESKSLLNCLQCFMLFEKVLSWDCGCPYPMVGIVERVTSIFAVFIFSLLQFYFVFFTWIIFIHLFSKNREIHHGKGSLTWQVT